jgi:hypothetical protein
MKLTNIVAVEKEQREDVSAEKRSTGKGTNERDVTMTGEVREGGRGTES